MCELCPAGCDCECRYVHARKRISTEGDYAEIEAYCTVCLHPLGEVQLDA